MNKYLIGRETNEINIKRLDLIDQQLKHIKRIKGICTLNLSLLTPFSNSSRLIYFKP